MRISGTSTLLLFVARGHGADQLRHSNLPHTVLDLPGHFTGQTRHNKCHPHPRQAFSYWTPKTKRDLPSDLWYRGIVTLNIVGATLGGIVGYKPIASLVDTLDCVMNVVILLMLS